MEYNLDIINKEIKKIKRIVCCVLEQDAPSTFDAVISGLTTTEDATPTSLISYTPTQDGAYSFQSRIVGYSPGGEAAYFNMSAIVVVEGGTVDIVNQTQMFTPMQSSGVTNTDVSATTDGTSVVLTVIGESATTIHWKAFSTLVNVF